jgi:hypothetical protein
MYIRCRRADNSDTPLFTRVLVFTGIDTENYALQLNKTVKQDYDPFHNKLDAFLLPFSLTYNYLSVIDLQCKKPTIIVYDALGRIRSLILSSCNHLILENQWIPKELKSTEIEITAINHHTGTLDSTFSLFDKLLIPPKSLEELKSWFPSGTYKVTHDNENRVFSIKRDDTEIELGEFWEYRYTETLTPIIEVEMV